MKRMREQILAWGGEVCFESCVTDLVTQGKEVVGIQINGEEIIRTKAVVLAIGHSARDTFSMLEGRGVEMTSKSFAVGLRIEHSQSMITESQYGNGDKGRELGAASYKLTAQASNGRGVYSFCMCPGGYVVNASSEQGRLAVNGMSNRKRDGKNANAALIVTVTPKTLKRKAH